MVLDLWWYYVKIIMLLKIWQIKTYLIHPTYRRIKAYRQRTLVGLVTYPQGPMAGWGLGPVFLPSMEGDQHTMYTVQKKTLELKIRGKVYSIHTSCTSLQSWKSWVEPLSAKSHPWLLIDVKRLNFYCFCWFKIRICKFNKFNATITSDRTMTRLHPDFFS